MYNSIIGLYVFRKTHRRLGTAGQPNARKKLAPSFPCRSRTGMSCAVDTAWQKRGFDSLTCKFNNFQIQYQFIETEWREQET